MKGNEFLDKMELIDPAYVEAADAKPKRRKIAWVKWGAMAACLCFVIACSLIATELHDGYEVEPQPSKTPDQSIVQPGNDHQVVPPETANLLVINEVEIVTAVDMDVQIASFDKLPYDVWAAILEEFHGFMGISYEEFIDKVPNDFEYCNFYSLSTHGYKDANLKDEYRLHDYVFEYLTKNGGEVIIAICPNEEPLRDYFVKCDNPELSEINGIEVVIYGYQDTFMVQFSHEKIYYDIEVRNITQEELEDLLIGIIE